MLNTIKVLTSKALIDLYISHDEFVSVNNVLREYNEVKNYVYNIKTSCKKTTANDNLNVKKTKENRLMLLWYCAVCCKKKSTFIKNQWIKSLTNFYWLEKKICQNCI